MLGMQKVASMVGTATNEISYCALAHVQPHYFNYCPLPNGARKPVLLVRRFPDFSNPLPLTAPLLCAYRGKLNATLRSFVQTPRTMQCLRDLCSQLNHIHWSLDIYHSLIKQASSNPSSVSNLVKNGSLEISPPGRRE